MECPLLSLLYDEYVSVPELYSDDDDDDDASEKC